ncbi:MAG: hypothetical protein GC160_17160 [Acidobacteria bacterium]|nr:hypothetical protein [Acidobacteriota bacterium]
MADQSKHAAAASKTAARLSAARDEYRAQVRSKFDPTTLDSLRQSIASGRKAVRSLDLDFDDDGLYRPDKEVELKKQQNAAHSRLLQRKGIDPQELKAFNKQSIANAVRPFGSMFKSDSSINMIMRNWTAEVEASNDPDLRQILRYPTHRRTWQDHIGNHDVLSTYQVADRSRGLVGSHHVWENHDVDDFDYFAIDLQSQIGHGLWLKAGESFQAVAHLRCIDTMVQIDGHDEWGWSEAFLSSSNYGVMNLGGQTRESRLWVVSNEIENAFKRPFQYGQRAILAADFGPIPADGYYVLWAGTRSYMYSIQNDWSLSVLMRAFWDVEQVLIRQTPDQRG